MVRALASHQLMWPGFKSRRRRHMWVEFVVGSPRYSERFFSGYSGFLLSSKTNISKFQFDQESGRRRTTMWMCYLQIVIYLFIYLTLGCAVKREETLTRLEEYLRWEDMLPLTPFPNLPFSNFCSTKKS